MASKKLTPKQDEILSHMWSCRFARSMTLTDFSKNTINSLTQKGLIAWDPDARTGPPAFGLTAFGIAFCEREYGPRIAA